VNDFIRNLCFHCTERMELPKDRTTSTASEQILQLEAEIQHKVGYDLLNRYQCAVDEFYAHQFDEAFLRGMRFGTQFMLSVFPQSSDTTSTP